MVLKKIVTLMIIPAIALFGDTVVNQYKFSIFPLILKCLADSSTHFLIGLLSWNVVENIPSPNTKSYFFWLLLCGLISSLIDIDHFFESGTVSLEVATSLQKRPLFHCTTIFLITSLVLVILSIRIQSHNLHQLSWIIITASLTHHWRDGYRRGLWICPYGSSSPYRYNIYIIGLVFLPVLLNFGYKFTSKYLRQSNCQQSTNYDALQPKYTV